MCHFRVAAAICCIVLLVPIQLRGDSWAAATPIAVASPDGDRLVRVEPGDSLGDTVGFAGANKGSFARATYYFRNEAEDTYNPIRSIDLKNPISPVDVHLNNAGVLVTLDNWHNMGYGSVIVIFDRDGRLLKSYELEDIYSENRINEILHSVSSRWWRCQSVKPWINDGEFWLMDSFGGEFRFDLNNGSYEYEKFGGKCIER